MVKGNGKITANDPAYTTLLNEFFLKTKRIEIENNVWQKQLKQFFTLSTNILDNKSGEPFNWEEIDANRVINVQKCTKNLDGRDNFHIRKIICRKFDPLNNEHKIIYNLHSNVRDRIIFEPKANEVKGLMKAFEIFVKKTIDETYLKFIKDQLHNAKATYDDIVEKIADEIKCIVEFKKKYITQIKYFNQTLSDTYKKLDVARLNEIQTEIFKLRKTQNTLKNSLQSVDDILDDYNIERIMLAEFLMNIKFYREFS